MNRPVERDPGVPAGVAPNVAAMLAAVGPPPVSLDPEMEPESRLPHDHPVWARDVVSLSQRARTLFAQLRPIVLRVISVWEHRMRSIVVGGRTLSVDAAGCYRTG